MTTKSEKLGPQSDERIVGISGLHLDCIYEDLKEKGIECDITTQMILVKKRDAEEAIRILQNYRYKVKMRTRINVYRDSVKNINYLVELFELPASRLAKMFGTTPRRFLRLVSGETKCTLEDMEDFAAIFNVDPGKLTYLTHNQFLNYLEEIQWDKNNCMVAVNSQP